MTSLVKRVLLTFTMVPALFALIYFLPHYQHLAFAILAVVVTAYGSYEVKTLAFSGEEKPLIPFWLPAFLPAAEYIEMALDFSIPIAESILFVLIALSFTIEIKRGERDHFKLSMHRISRTLFLIIYPGFFALFLVRILSFEYATELLLLLFLLVFANDVFAYVFGMSFGKTNRNIVEVSPNKSMAGFIGGTISAMILGLLFVRFVPSMHALFTWWEALVIGFVSSLASILGDLIESTFKRSAGKKDSGTIMMGRGGLLDSIDSLLITAPFYMFFTTLFSL